MVHARCSFVSSRTRCICLWSARQSTVRDAPSKVMSVNLNKLKNLLTAKSSASDGEQPRVDSKPQVGFRVSYCQAARRMKVKVIGARHLPTVYGTVRPVGYLVKVGKLSAAVKCENSSRLHLPLTFHRLSQRTFAGESLSVYK